MYRIAKAQDLYLRGFGGNYIRRRTGVSLNEVRGSLPDSSKEEIVRYQAAYIRRKWTDGEIDAARAWLTEHGGEAVAKAGRHQLVILGCCFGQWQRVFRRLESEMTK